MTAETADALHDSDTPERSRGPHVVGVRDLAESPLAIEEIIRASEAYAKTYERRMVGPQREGMLPSEVISALSDPRSVALEIESPSGHIVWPLFVPVEHNSEYRQDFFSDHYGEKAVETYFYSAPPEGCIDLETDEMLTGHIAKGLSSFIRRNNPVVVLDYEQGQDYTPDTLRKILKQANASDEDITPNDPKYGPPTVVYNETHVRPVDRTQGPKSVRQVFEEGLANGEFERRPKDGATLLMPEDFLADDSALLKRVWEIYEEQFNILVEDHPSRQKQSQAEIVSELTSEKSTVSSCFMDGEIIGDCFFVSDRKECDWLNQKFYEERYGDRPLSIYPGIVIDVHKIGAHHADAMLDLLVDVQAKTGKDAEILFQCTNISQTYVPKIVRRAVERSTTLTMEPFNRVATYDYKVHQVKPRRLAL